MGENARATALQKFGIVRMIDETIAAYKSAAEQKTEFSWVPDWEDEAAARSHVEDLVQEKVGKGYREVGAES